MRVDEGQKSPQRGAPPPRPPPLPQHLLSAALVPAQDVESVTERPERAGPCVACPCDRAEVRRYAEESQTVRAGRGKR